MFATRAWNSALATNCWRTFSRVRAWLLRSVTQKFTPPRSPPRRRKALYRSPTYWALVRFLPVYSVLPANPDEIASAMLFTAAKLSHLHHLPQGQPERLRRTLGMVTAMDAAGFGNCSNHYECEAACPKDISRDVIAELNRDYAKASFAHREHHAKSDGA